MPFKSLMYAVRAVAIAGFILSVAIHVIVLTTDASDDWVYVLIVGFFALLPVCIAAIYAQERLTVELRRTWCDFLQLRLLGRGYREAVEANAPLWLRRTTYALLAYALISFAFFAYEVYPDRQPGKEDARRLMSAFLVTFWAFATLVLTSYLRTQRPIRPDEIRSRRG